MIVVTLFLSLFVSHVLAQTSCNDLGECEDTNVSDGYVYCYGYVSCEGATIQADQYLGCEGYLGCYGATITGFDVSCDGSFACYDADIDIDDDLFCDGDYGCYYATATVGDNLYCDGEYACYGSTLEITDYLYCRGDGACRYADIIFFNGGSRIYANGYYTGYYLDLDSDPSLELTNYVYGYSWYSLAYANLYSGEENDYYFYFYGYRSGYYATVYCEADATCYVYCYGYACYETEVYCDSTSDCLGWDASATALAEGESDYIPKKLSWDSKTDKLKKQKLRKKDKVIHMTNDQKLSDGDKDESIGALESDPIYKKHLSFGLPTLNADMEEESRNDKHKILLKKLTSKALLNNHFMNHHYGVIIGCGIVVAIVVMFAVWFAYRRAKTNSTPLNT